MSKQKIEQTDEQIIEQPVKQIKAPATIDEIIEMYNTVIENAQINGADKLVSNFIKAKAEAIARYKATSAKK